MGLRRTALGATDVKPSMRNTISIILLVLLVPLTVAMFFVTTIQMHLLTASFLKRELVKRDAYGLANDQIDTQISKVKIDPQYPVTTAEISALAHRVFPASWLQSNIESTLDHFDAWLKTPAGTPLSLPIDLAGPKRELTSGVDSLLTAKLPTIKPCPSKRLPKEQQGICQFAGLTLTQLKAQLKHIGLDPDVVASVLPDTLDLIHPDVSKITGSKTDTTPGGAQAKSAQLQASLDRFKNGYHNVRYYYLMAVVVYGLLIAAYIFLNAWSGLRRLVRWAGILLVTVSAIPIAISIASIPMYDRLVVPRIHFASAVPEAVQTAALGALSDIRSAIFSPVLFLTASLFILGLAGIIGAGWVQVRGQKND